MSMSNIKFQIDTGSSLSGAIDKKLDETMGQDVSLNRSQWNSVFAIVREDKATAEKQYTGGDTDITNGKHFQVKAGQWYELTKAAWDKIIAIAKGEQPQAAKTPQSEDVRIIPPENETKDTQKTAEENVKTILTENNVKVDDAELKNVVDKYNAFLEYAKMNQLDINSEKVQNKLNETIVNYARSLKFSAFENAISSENSETNEFVIEGINENSTGKEIAAAYLQFGKEQVAHLDTDFDGKISFNEFLKEHGGEVDEEIARELFNEISSDDKYITALDAGKYYSVIANINDDNSYGSITKEEFGLEE